MEDAPDSFDRFLKELTASLETEAGEATLRRINAERLTLLALEEFVQQHADHHIRVLPDQRLSGLAGADILLQIDEYEVRLEIIDASGLEAITQEQLGGFEKIFEDNPSTEALVLVWSVEELLANLLTLKLIATLKSRPFGEIGLPSLGRPLLDVLNEIFQTKLKIWGTSLDLKERRLNEKFDIPALFSAHLVDNVREERSRPYRDRERKLAAVRYPEKEETEVLLDILNSSLHGEEISTLAEKLARLPRRRRA